ncbi:hypothetical protein [Streptomyces sp. NPDC096132]|uniref:hypothetical protein n=1 Tax=Streptomyces sp. NPDC096132 TaxID=3366075 RepID=UPI00381EE50C
MSIMLDPTTLDGSVRPAKRNDLKEPTRQAEQGAAVEAAPPEPEAQDLDRLRARVARLEARNAFEEAAAETTVGGRYRSAGAGTQLELRVDVDGPRPLMRISGDFFEETTRP